MKHRTISAADTYDVAVVAQLADKRDRHAGSTATASTAGPTSESSRGRLERKRATCWSKRYVEADTRVPPAAGEVPTTISSPPCPRNVAYPGPSFSRNAA